MIKKLQRLVNRLDSNKQYSQNVFYSNNLYTGIGIGIESHLNNSFNKIIVFIIFIF